MAGEIKRQISTLWRTATSSLGTVREVVVRSSQAGRLRVEVALLRKERQQALIELGGHVAALVSAGRLDPPPSLRALLRVLDDVEVRLEAESTRAHDNAFGATRGYEPEAGNYVDDSDESDEDGGR